jgi:hypothetical protein
MHGRNIKMLPIHCRKKENLYDRLKRNFKAVFKRSNKGIEGPQRFTMNIHIVKIK